MAVQHTPRWSRLPERFPNTIRSYRLRAGLTQRQLGERLGCLRGAVSNWERGLTFPRGVRLLRLAKVIGTLVESFYYDLYAAEQYFEDNMGS